MIIIYLENIITYQSNHLHVFSYRFHGLFSLSCFRQSETVLGQIIEIDLELQPYKFPSLRLYFRIMKSYLRYQPEKTFGVITSPNSNTIYDFSGHLALTGSVRDVTVWNLRHGSNVCSLSLLNFN
jgi:hypothetical protein